MSASSGVIQDLQSKMLYFLFGSVADPPLVYLKIRPPGSHNGQKWALMGFWWNCGLQQDRTSGLINQAFLRKDRNTSINYPVLYKQGQTRLI